MYLFLLFHKVLFLSSMPLVLKEGEKKDTQHHTDASEKMRNYYTPELERFVELRYWKDYYNPYFHFTPFKLFSVNETGNNN